MQVLPRFSSNAECENFKKCIDNIQPDDNNFEELFKCENPCYPSMRNENDRLNTFRTWDTTTTHATPQLLASCGFYYLGQEDKVKCFYCGGGLKDWDYNEDPWIEHAKWYPNCEYLLQKKGTEFVCDISSRFQKLNRPYNIGYRHPEELPINAPSVRSPSPPRSLPLTIQEPLPPIFPSPPSPPSLPENFTFRNFNSEEGSITINGQNIRIPNAGPMRITINGNTVTTHSGEGGNISFSSATNSSEYEIRRQLKDMDFPEPEIVACFSRLRSRSSPINLDSALEELTSTAGEAPRYNQEATSSESQNVLAKGPCVICLENAKEMIMVPCGHFCSCRECGRRLEKCPICRANVERLVRVYPS